MRDKVRSLWFETTTEKLDTVRAFNELLRSVGKPAAHEGLQQSDPLLFNVYLCIHETAVELPKPKAE